MVPKSTSTSALDRAAIEAEGAFIDGRLNNIALKHKQLRALFSKSWMAGTDMEDITLTLGLVTTCHRDLAGKRRCSARFGIRKLFLGLRIRDSARLEDHLRGRFRVALGPGESC